MTATAVKPDSKPKQAPNNDDFSKAVQAEVKAYLDANLEELVKAAMPPTPEQLQQRERETLEERVAKDRAAAERRARREARDAEKAAAAAAEAQAKRDDEARKAFAGALSFEGNVADISAKIIRDIRIDNGEAYSAELVFPVRASELEPSSDGGLLLAKTIELPARGREFDVRGISLITDAGALRIALNGSRKCGGGKGVQFPARSLVFRPAVPTASDTE